MDVKFATTLKHAKLVGNREALVQMAATFVSVNKDFMIITTHVKHVSEDASTVRTGNHATSVIMPTIIFLIITHAFATMLNIISMVDLIVYVKEDTLNKLMFVNNAQWVVLHAQPFQIVRSVIQINRLEMAFVSAL